MLGAGVMMRRFLVTTMALVLTAGATARGDISITLATSDLSAVHVGDTIHVEVDAKIDDPAAGVSISYIQIDVSHSGLTLPSNTSPVFVVAPAIAVGGTDAGSRSSNDVTSFIYSYPGSGRPGYTGRVMEFDLLATASGPFELDASGYFQTMSNLPVLSGQQVFASPTSLPVTVLAALPTTVLAGDAAVAPEPSTAFLAGAGALLWLGHAWRRRRSA